MNGLRLFLFLERADIIGLHYHATGTNGDVIGTHSSKLKISGKTHDESDLQMTYIYNILVNCVPDASEDDPG